MRNRYRISVCRPVLVAAVCVMTLGSPKLLEAQQSDEPAFQRLLAHVQRDYLRLGLLLQTVADVQIDRTATGGNGFNISNFRVALSGELDAGFGYFLQTNFAAAPAILDASMYYDVSRALRLRVGQFKAPFSREFLTSAASIDFVNRAQGVTALAPGRQLGMSVTAANTSGTAGVSAGLFNGNGTAPNGNDGNELLYAARVFGTLRPVNAGSDDTTIDVGVNVAYSRDGSARLPGIATVFAGKRTLVGLDAGTRIGRTSLSGEVILASLNPDVGETRNPWGLHLTAGYMMTGKTQALIRFDGLDADAIAGRSDLIIFGFNAWPTTVTEFQVNYVIDTGDAAFDHHQLLVNFQFGF